MYILYIINNSDHDPWTLFIASDVVQYNLGPGWLDLTDGVCPGLINATPKELYIVLEYELLNVTFLMYVYSQIVVLSTGAHQAYSDVMERTKKGWCFSKSHTNLQVFLHLQQVKQGLKG